MQSLVLQLFRRRHYINAAAIRGTEAANLALKDANEQVALDASTAYIELDTVDPRTRAARQQENSLPAWSRSSNNAPKPASIPISELLQARLTAAQSNLPRLASGNAGRHSRQATRRV